MGDAVAAREKGPDSVSEYPGPGSRCVAVAFDGDKPRLALWLPGGAGASINNAEIHLYDRRGLPEIPQKDASGNNVVTTTDRTGVTLTRASAKRTGSKYNFYIEAPNELKLGMTYDPTNPDSTLMVSRECGSLRGSVEFAGFGNWAITPNVEKAVSRPWVEWKGFEQPPTGAESIGGTTRLIDHPPYFVLGPNRNFRAVVVFNKTTMPGTLTCQLGDTAAGSLGGDTSKTVLFGTHQEVELRLSLNGSRTTTPPLQDRLVFTLLPTIGAPRVVGTIEIAVFEPKVEFAWDGDGNYQADPSDPEAMWLDIGLWDEAFRRTVPYGDLYQGKAEADNFIGRDMQRFYVRISNPAALPNDNGEVFVDFYTDADHPANSQITTRAHLSSKGTFVSKALMLDSDQQDFKDCNSPSSSFVLKTGLWYEPQNAARGDRDYRMRYATTDSNVTVRYQPVLPSGRVWEKTLHVFQRSPDFRRSVIINVYNMSDLPNNVPPLQTEIVDTIKTRIIALLAQAAIKPVFMDQTIDMQGKANFSLLHVNSSAFSMDQLYLRNAIKDWTGYDPTEGDELQLVLVHGFTGGELGFSYPDYTFPTNNQLRNMCFVAGGQGDLTYTHVHEIVHMLGVDHYNDNSPVKSRNLMWRWANYQACTPYLSKKRLWYLNADGPSQNDIIRASRYVKSY